MNTLPHQVGRFAEHQYPKDTKTYRALQDFYVAPDALLETGRSLYWSASAQTAIWQHQTNVELDVRFPLSTAQLQEMIDSFLLRSNEQ